MLSRATVIVSESVGSAAAWPPACAAGARRAATARTALQAARSDEELRLLVLV